MTTLPHVSRKSFLSRLRRSGLLTGEELDRARGVAPLTHRGRVLARALVEHRILTRFQAERLLVGRTEGFLLGQYVVLEELGRGGMGRVYKARHRGLNRLVALKVLAPELTRTERTRELFLREVRAAAQLAHPNIVTAYDASESGGRYYLVLEYVDGPNLEQLVARRGRLDVGLACDVVRQAATGLQCAHTAGMVHRDIKPGNLLLSVVRGPLPIGHIPEGPPRSPYDPGPDHGSTELAAVVKITDFGLARLQGPHGAACHETIITRPNTVMGTPDFLSPEQARNLHNTDIRSDLYSLGCTLYFLLTGQVPFPGGTSLEKLLRHNTEQPMPVEQLRPEIPTAVAAMVRKLMAKSPEQRFQHPADVAEALAPFSTGGPTPWEGLHPTVSALPELDTPVSGLVDPLVDTPSPGLTPLTTEALPARSLPPNLPPVSRSVWGSVLPWLLLGAGGLLALAAGVAALYPW
jgi:eukaryotic-like serine/threonine-protein kinase